MIKNFIPSAITLSNLTCGFLVILLPNQYGIALILLGGLFDVFDGGVARLLNAQSDIGKELDSLADIVTFGVAPSYLLSSFLPTPWKWICILPVLTGAYRLARFNVKESGNYYFSGMAIPASALFYVGLILILEQQVMIPQLLLVLLIFVPALLNLSSLKMFSFKGLQKDEYTKYLMGALVIVGVVCLIINFYWTLIVIMVMYILLSFYYHIKLNQVNK